jgi:hypothetical protein
MVWFVRTRREWLRLVLTFGLASVPILPLVAGYRHYQAALGADRGIGEIEAFSADLGAVWAASAHTWLPAHWTFAPRAEGELYAGAAILVLTIAGVLSAWRAGGWALRMRRGFLIFACFAWGLALLAWVTGGLELEVAGVRLSMTRTHRAVGVGIWLFLIALSGEPRLRQAWRTRSQQAFYVMAALAMLAFALGPVWHVFDLRVMDRAPYYWLMQLPGGSALRVPARFAMLFVLCLGQAAALGLTRLAPRRLGVPAVALLALVVLADGWVPRFPVAEVPAPMALANVDPEAAVVQLPSRDLYDDTPAMLRATGHGHPLVNGFSGYAPAHYAPFQEGAQALDRSVLDAFRTFAPLVVVIDRARDGDGRYAAFVDAIPEVAGRFDSAAGPVFTLPRLTGAQPERDDPVATVSGLVATSHPGIETAMLDGDLTTRWQTDGVQERGDEVRVSLAVETLVSRIELDLGGDALVYPRRLRVSVVEAGDGPARVVWEGGTAGYAVLAAHRDRVRMPMRIDLPDVARARSVLLTVVSDEAPREWAIAELRIFGAPATPAGTTAEP